MEICRKDFCWSRVFREFLFLVAIVTKSSPLKKKKSQPDTSPFVCSSCFPRWRRTPTDFWKNLKESQRTRPLMSNSTRFLFLFFVSRIKSCDVAWEWERSGLALRFTTGSSVNVGERELVTVSGFSEQTERVLLSSLRPVTGLWLRSVWMSWPALLLVSRLTPWTTPTTPWMFIWRRSWTSKSGLSCCSVCPCRSSTDTAAHKQIFSNNCQLINITKTAKGSSKSYIFAGYKEKI